MNSIMPPLSFMKETVVRGLISIIEELGFDEYHRKARGLINIIEDLGVDEYHRKAGGLMNIIEELGG